MHANNKPPHIFIHIPNQIKATEIYRPFFKIKVLYIVFPFIADTIKLMYYMLYKLKKRTPLMVELY